MHSILKSSFGLFVALGLLVPPMALACNKANRHNAGNPGPGLDADEPVSCDLGSITLKIGASGTIVSGEGGIEIDLGTTECAVGGTKYFGQVKECHEPGEWANQNCVTDPNAVRYELLAGGRCRNITELVNVAGMAVDFAELINDGDSEGLKNALSGETCEAPQKDDSVDEEADEDKLDSVKIESCHQCPAPAST